MTESPKGYSGTPLVKKLGIKPGQTVIALNPPENYGLLLGELPSNAVIEYELEEKSDFIHCFVKSIKELEIKFPRLKKLLVPNGSLWISWPKQSSGGETNLNETIIRELGLASNLVDVKVCAIDDTWSGLKFVYRVEDRQSSK